MNITQRVKLNTRITWKALRIAENVRIAWSPAWLEILRAPGGAGIILLNADTIQQDR
jgi:hypothetical protein